MSFGIRSITLQLDTGKCYSITGNSSQPANQAKTYVSDWLVLHLLPKLRRKVGPSLLQTNLKSQVRECITFASPEFHQIISVQTDGGSQETDGVCLHSACVKHRWYVTVLYTLVTDLLLEIFPRLVAAAMATAGACGAVWALPPALDCWSVISGSCSRKAQCRSLTPIMNGFWISYAELCLLFAAQNRVVIWGLKPLPVGVLQRMWVAPLGLGSYVTWRRDGVMGWWGLLLFLCVTPTVEN